MGAAYESTGVPLRDVAEGKVARIVGLACDPVLRQRLASLGVRTGTEVSVLQRTGGGRAVVRIGFGHLAAGVDVMRSILVAVPPQDA